MGNLFRSAAVVAVLALGAGSASATTVTLDRQDANDVFAGGGAATVRVTADGVVSNIRVRAGAFRVRNGMDDFLAFCADLANTLRLPSLYAERPFENPPLSFSQTVIDRVQALFNTAYAGLDLNDDVESGAFQLALWNIIYDTNDTVNSGSFRWVGNENSVTSTGARDQANLFLAGLDGPVTQVYTLTFWEAQPESGKSLSQSLISAAPIPLPAAAWMLIAALGAAAAVSRRRRDV